MLPALFRRARLWVRGAAIMLAILLATSALLPASMSAAVPPDDYQPQMTSYVAPVSEAIDLLQKYGIIRGDQTGNLRLNDGISRAEMVTILVRLLGKEADATRLTGSASFSDTGRHWASGYITVARNLGLAQGYPDGTFRPDNSVTYAEAAALLLRTVGKDPGTGPWPDVVVNQAVSLGIEPPNVSLAVVAGNAAPRLHVFQSLFLAGTRIQLTSSGKTAFQTYIDTTPPALNVTPLPAYTSADTATISGSAPDAAAVFIDSKQITLGQGGSFQYTVKLVSGLNTFMIEAFDAVGNRNVVTVATTRGANAAKIEVSGPTTVAAGGKVQYTVKVLDASGADIGVGGLQVTTVGGIGSYDLTTHTFTAVNNTANGKLVFQVGTLTKEVAISVVGPDSAASALRFGNLAADPVLAIDQSYLLRVDVVDEDGDLVTSDNGRAVRLTASGNADIDISPSVGYTSGGSVTFSIRATEAGTATLRATADGLTTASASVQVATSRRIVLVANPTQLLPDGESEAEITAHLLDQNGNPVTWNGSRDLVIELNESGPGELLDDEISIPRGYSYSVWDTGLVQAGDSKGTLRVSGEVIEGTSYTVIPVSIPVEEPKASSGMRLVVTGPTSADVGKTVTYTVEVRDSNGYLVTSGSYAFQIKIDTSNKDEKVDGIPDGVTVSLGDTGLNPVDDGYAETHDKDGWDVIARTYRGKATIKLSYDKSGQVTITPVPKGYTSEAYDSEGDEGSASSTTSIKDITSITTSFVNDPVAVKVEVDSVLGNGQPGGAVGTGSGTVKIRARIVDEGGNWIPGIGDYTITLYKDSGDSTSIVGNSSVKAKDGMAEFTIRSSSKEGTDIYYARAEKGTIFNRSRLWAYNEVSIDVEKSKPKINSNIIVAINGYKDDDITEFYFVGSDDDGMAIALDPIATNGERVAVVKVYRVDGSRNTLIYTSDVVEFNPGQLTIIYVPKSALKDGSYRYAVSIRNSRGESEISNPSDVVAMPGGYSSTTISGAQFSALKDGVKNVLTVNTSSIRCDGVIDTSKLSIVAGSKKISLAGAPWLIGTSAKEGCTSSSTQRQFQVLLSDSQVNQLFSADFAGNDPEIEAEAGWYVGANRQMADEDKEGNAIGALTYVDRVEADWANKRLYLIGGGFNAVKTLDYTTIVFQKGKTQVALTDQMVDKVTRQSDSVYLITLEGTALRDELKAQGLTGSVQVVLGEGWAKQTSSVGPELTRTLYHAATISAVEYSNGTLRLTGSGFAGGTANAGKMYVQKWGASKKAVGGTAKVKDNGHIDVEGVTKANFDGTYIFFLADDGWWTDSETKLPAYRVDSIGIRK